MLRPIIISIFIAAGMALSFMNSCGAGEKGKKENAVFELPQKLTLMSWNVGYAGLGSETDFFADGGKNVRTKSKKHVEKNVFGIRGIIGGNSADIYLFQEIARPSFINYHHDVLASVSQTLRTYRFEYKTQAKTVLIPWPFNINVGTAIFTKGNPMTIAHHALPGARNGLFRQHFYLSLEKFRISGRNESWVIGNLHIAAFDDDAAIRKQQVNEIITIARKEYDKGNYVVVGGDWNLVPVKTDFPHTTEKRFLFWIHDFPKESIPDGWKLCFDESAPTVRTLHKSYVKNENYVTIIDGFLCSPNVVITRTATIDQAFEYSDHNPVLVTVETE